MKNTAYNTVPGGPTWCLVGSSLDLPMAMEAHPGDVEAVLWNRNDLLQFRFRLCKSFDSGSGTRPVPDPDYI
jgi:hypothetical protein